MRENMGDREKKSSFNEERKGRRGREEGNVRRINKVEKEEWRNVAKRIVGLQGQHDRKGGGEGEEVRQEVNQG